jgi:hypothetical protein
MSDEKTSQDQLNDLANRVSRSTVAVVDAITQRGGFKGEELSTIGGLRDQCVQVIQLVEQLQQEKAMES